MISSRFGYCLRMILSENRFTLFRIWGSAPYFISASTSLRNAWREASRE
jgi:hypothetical protein